MNIVGKKIIDVTPENGDPIQGIKLFCLDSDCPISDGFGVEVSTQWVDKNKAPGLYDLINGIVTDPGEYDIRLNKKGKIAELQPGLRK